MEIAGEGLKLGEWLGAPEPSRERLVAGDEACPVTRSAHLDGGGDDLGDVAAVKRDLLAQQDDAAMLGFDLARDRLDLRGPCDERGEVKAEGYCDRSPSPRRT